MSNTCFPLNLCIAFDAPTRRNPLREGYMVYDVHSPPAQCSHECTDAITELPCGKFRKRIEAYNEQHSPLPRPGLAAPTFWLEPQLAATVTCRRLHPLPGPMAPFTLPAPPDVLASEMSSYWLPLCREGGVSQKAERRWDMEIGYKQHARSLCLIFRLRELWVEQRWRVKVGGNGNTPRKPAGQRKLNLNCFGGKVETLPRDHIGQLWVYCWHYWMITGTEYLWVYTNGPVMADCWQQDTLACHQWRVNGMLMEIKLMAGRHTLQMRSVQYFRDVMCITNTISEDFPKIYTNRCLQRYLRTVHRVLPQTSRQGSPLKFPLGTCSARVVRLGAKSYLMRVAVTPLSLLRFSGVELREQLQVHAGLNPPGRPCPLPLPPRDYLRSVNDSRGGLMERIVCDDSRLPPPPQKKTSNHSCPPPPPITPFNYYRQRFGRTTGLSVVGARLGRPPNGVQSSSRKRFIKKPSNVVVEERYRRQDLMSVQCYARRGDKRVDAHVSVALSAPTLLGLRRAKFLQPGGHLEKRFNKLLNFLCEDRRATRPGIEPISPWWEASRLTAQPLRPLLSVFYAGGCTEPDCEQGCPAVSLLASHQSDPGSIPGRVTPDFRMWESCRMMPLVGGFSRGSPVSPALSFRRCSSITYIGSQDLDVKSRPDLFTHSMTQLSFVCTRRRNALKVEPKQGLVKLSLHEAEEYPGSRTIAGLQKRLNCLHCLDGDHLPMSVPPGLRPNGIKTRLSHSRVGDGLFLLRESIGRSHLRPDANWKSCVRGSTWPPWRDISRRPNSRLAKKHLANPITARCGAAASEHTAEAPVWRVLRSLAYRSLNSRNCPPTANITIYNNRERWRWGNTLGTYCGDPGFDYRYGHPDFSFPLFPEITPGEYWVDPILQGHPFPVPASNGRAAADEEFVGSQEPPFSAEAHARCANLLGCVSWEACAGAPASPYLREKHRLKTRLVQTLLPNGFNSTRVTTAKVTETRQSKLSVLLQTFNVIPKCTAVILQVTNPSSSQEVASYSGPCHYFTSHVHDRKRVAHKKHIHGQCYTQQGINARGTSVFLICEKYILLSPTSTSTQRRRSLDASNSSNALSELNQPCSRISCSSVDPGPGNTGSVSWYTCDFLHRWKSSGAAPFPPSFNLIGSQNLDASKEQRENERARVKRNLRENPATIVRFSHAKIVGNRTRFAQVGGDVRGAFVRRYLAFAPLPISHPVTRYTGTLDPPRKYKVIPLSLGAIVGTGKIVHQFNVLHVEATGVFHARASADLIASFVFGAPPMLFPRDEGVDAHVSVAPSAPTLLGLRRAKFLQPGGHLEKRFVDKDNFNISFQLHLYGKSAKTDPTRFDASNEKKVVPSRSKTGRSSVVLHDVASVWSGILWHRPATVALQHACKPIRYSHPSPDNIRSKLSESYRSVGHKGAVSTPYERGVGTREIREFNDLCGATVNEHIAEAESPVCRGMRSLAYRSLNSRNFPNPSYMINLGEKKLTLRPDCKRCPELTDSITELTRKITTPRSSAYWSLNCVFIDCYPTPGSYGIRKVFPCKSAIGSEACRASLINCDPIVKSQQIRDNVVPVIVYGDANHSESRRDFPARGVERIASFDSTVLYAIVHSSVAHWLLAATMEDNDWACIRLYVSHWPKVHQEVSNNVWTNGKGCTKSSAYWSLNCVFIGCCPTPGSYAIRKQFPCKSAIGSQACRTGLINCDPIAKQKDKKREIPPIRPEKEGGWGRDTSENDKYQVCALAINLRAFYITEIYYKSFPDFVKFTGNNWIRFAGSELQISEIQDPRPARNCNKASSSSALRFSYTKSCSNVLTKRERKAEVTIHSSSLELCSNFAVRPRRLYITSFESSTSGISCPVLCQQGRRLYVSKHACEGEQRQYCKSSEPNTIEEGVGGGKAPDSCIVTQPRQARRDSPDQHDTTAPTSTTRQPRKARHDSPDKHDTTAPTRHGRCDSRIKQAYSRQIHGCVPGRRYLVCLTNEQSEVNMEQRWNERDGETDDSKKKKKKKNPADQRHDSHMRKSGGDLAGN
ncbi:hypothetical protein PR048_010547 [Dryococelus australis]|uniref:Uncharacterized protein n=1 Tax=Dryococelus australis TaxID=614101 RepID=A0ABQ9I513_9NEOP|nr:hypothetical protein PR048_010547 [Dryococelus australis]